MNQSGVYKIQSKIKSERIYIGSSVKINIRWNEHLRYLKKGRHHSPTLQRHFDKYGEGDLVFEIIELCLPDWTTAREQYYLNNLKPYFNTCELAYSCRGVKRSPEVRDKISQGGKGIKRSVDFCRKLSKNKKGNKNMLGKKMSEETKKKISNSNKGKLLGRKQDPEHIKKRVRKLKGRIPPQSERDNIGKALKGRVFSDEWRRKIREAILKRGQLPPSRLGIKHTEETKVKMRKNRIAWNKGIPQSDEAKRNQSEKMKGRFAGDKNPNYGHRLSDEEKKKLSEYVKEGIRKKKEMEIQNFKIA